MGCGQFCCFPSPGYVIGRGPPGGPAVFGAASGVGYGYGSRSVPVPVPYTATSQMMVASYAPQPIAPSPVPFGALPATNIGIPTYGQTSIYNAPFAGPVQPLSGTVVSPIQPYGIGVNSIVRW